MIRYALKCPEGHGFESWFQSAGAFETLRASGHVSCPACGSTKVEKSLMAPQVQSGKGETPEKADPSEDIRRRIAALKAKVEAESDYVGGAFAREARAMHNGEAPERSIYGEANPEEARSLIEDGIPVAPLPFRPTRKSN